MWGTGTFPQCHPTPINTVLEMRLALVSLGCKRYFPIATRCCVCDIIYTGSPPRPKTAAGPPCLYEGSGILCISCL
jgi:hypothetical protein